MKQLHSLFLCLCSMQKTPNLYKVSVLHACFCFKDGKWNEFRDYKADPQRQGRDEEIKTVSNGK